ncbi:hypothetical protein [Leptospira sp. GIMC2001]|uniref:hypothetical protein n=1 Tax=Leptospira sp. GIMC2001 TaxID=1513297 RepID=UPI00234BBEE0|nr:hypothetical protein [Leptospira sp. GIMC2001]WCL50517.1 hypothetical protein O4O04_06765 [Leptospira sp. GIMC2001]
MFRCEGKMLTKSNWPEITIGNHEEKSQTSLSGHYSTPTSEKKSKNDSNSNNVPDKSEINGKNQLTDLELFSLCDRLLAGNNLELLGLACRSIVGRRSNLPIANAILRLAVENANHLTEKEKSEVWSDVLEKFSPWRAFTLARKYLSPEWKPDFIDSLFLQNGRLSPRMKNMVRGNPFEGRIPEWILRKPFGIAKQLLEKKEDSSPILNFLEERLPESYPAHTVLFVDAFLARDMSRFQNHYHSAGRMRYHPQSLYMKAIMDDIYGDKEQAKEILNLIHLTYPDWDMPSFLVRGNSYATHS